MRIFRCEQCGNALHFENVTCLRCGSSLAFLPDRMDLCAIESAGESLWRRKPTNHLAFPSAEHRNEGDGSHDERRYRLCSHHALTHSCNFAVPQDDPNPLCVSCRQTRMLPNLSIPENQKRWYRIEVAKRRLFYTLARLGLLDPEPPPGTAQGPSYRFLADMPGKSPVLTGHASGVITLNIAEADDDERVRRRLALHEPYRTLLGHLRHESGHHFWEVLVARAGDHGAFREMFGDERADYGQALKRHYAHRAPSDWQERFVSAYATAHPWEDWAETWAHYLHMVDLLETAASFSTRMIVPTAGHARTEQVSDPFDGKLGDFDDWLHQWVPLTVLVNSLTRSLGQEDAYPFALSPASLDKLRFVHDIIRRHRSAA